MGWRKEPPSRLPKAEEKAELKLIEESFGKDFVKGAHVAGAKHTDDGRDCER